MTEALDVELAVLIQVLQQVDGSQVTGRVIQEDKLAARVGGVDAIRVAAGVPIVDGGVVLHTRVGAGPGRFGDAAHQFTGFVGVDHAAVSTVAGLPGAVGKNGTHEFIGHADGIVGVLPGDGVVRLTVEVRRITGVDQRPRLLLFLSFPVDEIDNFRMVHVQNHHLGRPAGGAPGFGGACGAVENLQERHQSRGGPAAGQGLVLAPQAGEVGPRPGSVLEDTGLGLDQVEDGHEVVIDALDEAGRALGVLIGIIRGLDGVGIGIPVVVAAGAFDAVTMEEAAVEPYRGIEGTMLVDQQGGEFGFKGIGVFPAVEVTIQPLPCLADGARYPGHHLAHGCFAFSAGHTCLAEVLGDDDVGGQLGPGPRHLHLFHLKDYGAIRIRDDRGSLLILDFVQWVDPHFRQPARHVHEAGSFLRQPGGFLE